ncbi:MAG: DinB family protein [Candidatus Eisenbacteria bacterium]
MPTPADELTKSALTASAGDHPGTIRAFFPFWDTYFRPYLLDAVELLPAAQFDFKPRPEMLTARQVILHIAEAERWWIHHIVEREPYEDFVVKHEDPAQGWVTVYDAPDHNTLRFTLEEYHRHSQRLFGLAAKELERPVTHRRENGEERTYSLHWILSHVEEHELHHRAQLNMYLRLLGISPPAV